MKTQRTWLFLTVPILLLAATLLVVNTYKTFTHIPASVPAPEKVEAPYGMLPMDAILTYSPSTGMRLQLALTGFQVQARRQTVAPFNLQNVAGGFISSEDLKGKVAVVDLWATWCHSCVEEVPMYNQLYKAFEGQEDVSVVGIAVQSPRGDIPSKVRQLGIKYPVLIGDDRALHAFGRIQGYPTTIVMDKEGKIYKQYLGSVPNKEETIKQDVQHLLAEDPR